MTKLRKLPGVHIDWTGAGPYPVYASGVEVGSVEHEGISWTLTVGGTKARGFALVSDLCRETRKILRAKAKARDARLQKA